MMCAKPFRVGVAEYGCGQCMPCRMNRRRLWQTRLMLESYQHEACAFVTLTFSEEHLPTDGSVSVDDVQRFIKRLRFRISPRKIRYYAVGEYGDHHGRAHYHVLVFGCADPEVFRECWPFGLVHVGTVTPSSASYVASYVTKGATKDGDVRLKGRRPEFAVMSRRPGIGAGACGVIADSVLTKGGATYVVNHGDVPGTVRFENERRPLGRYLLKKIREACGYEDAGAVAYAEHLAELQADLLLVGARDAREQKRLQTLRRAKLLYSIHRSKKG